jgi:rRNA-processing protein FCF1
MADNFLFLDTNILLHCKPPREIAWKKYVKGSYKLVIAPIVIDEIDKHKRSQKKKIAARAKFFSKLFEQVMDIDDPDFILIANRPKAETFSTHTLDKAEQDDCLLAALLEFSQLNPESNSILVSEDIGPRLKAKTLGITSLKLPEKEQIAEEPDEAEIKLQKLTRENNELKNRIPKVDLYFDGRIKHINFDDFQGTETYEQFSAKRMEELTKKYPYHKIPFKMPTQRELIFHSALTENMMYNDSNRYNRELDEFFEIYQVDYLPELYKWKIVHLLSFEITLEIYNEGNVPAENIDLSLHFPDGIQINPGISFNPFPESPIPPLKPLPLDQLVMKLNDLRNEIQSPTNVSPSEPQPWISIKNANGCQVDMKCSYLKHHQSFKFSKLAVSFDTLDDMKGFEFEYQLNTANDPRLKTGKLQINFV